MISIQITGLCHKISSENAPQINLIQRASAVPRAQTVHPAPQRNIKNKGFSKESEVPLFFYTY
jgi:hypothetical protein